MIAETIYSLLQSVEADTYPAMVPQKVQLPFIVHFNVSTNPNRTKSGVSTLDVIRYQISHFAETLTEADALAESTRAIIDGYRGDATNKIDSIIFLNASASYDFESEAYHVINDYQIRLRR